MALTPEQTESERGAALVDPRILPGEGATAPGMADEFALTPLSALGYFAPALTVLILGLDWTVFWVCIGFEMILFLWARVVQMWIMPGGIVALVATLFMISPICFATFAFLFAVGVLASGSLLTVNGTPYEIALATRLAGLGAMGALSANAVRQFRKVTLAKIRFKRRINERYMFAGEPERRLFTGAQVIIENILLSFFGTLIVFVYVGLAMLITKAAALVLWPFVSEDRAVATGAVIGFAAVRLAWEAFRAYAHGTIGLEPKTERAILERFAAQSRKRIVLREPGT